MRLPKWLPLLMIKMGTTCSKKKVKTFFFSLYHTSKTVSEVSQTAKKYQNVVKMLSKSGQAEKEKKSQIAVLQQFGIDFLRCLAESNRCSRFCRPVPNRSAKAPFPYWDCKYRDFCGICKIYFAFLFFNSEITVDSP